MTDVLAPADWRGEPFRQLFERRILFLRGPLEDDRADELVAQLLALEAASHDPITLYIDSPGGSMTGMFAVYDTLQLLAPTVDTTCLGLAASAAAFLLCTGTGTRRAGQNARIMIHQPLSAVQGPSEDIQIQARNLLDLRDRMEQIMAERTGRSQEQIHTDTLRDRWLSAEQAREYGLIDEVRKATR